VAEIVRCGDCVNDEPEPVADDELLYRRRRPSGEALSTFFQILSPVSYLLIAQVTLLAPPVRFL
jgi:hypothetical protein